MRNRIIVCILSVVMIFSQLSTMVLAAPAETDVAAIGDIGFATVSAAMEAAENEDTITLLKDTVIDDTVVVNKEITLNLNGKTVSNTKDIWLDNDEVNKWSLISVQEGGNLTITGNGKLLAKENDIFAVDLMDGAKCTIKDGTFVGNIHAVYVLEDALTVEGGTFDVQ